MALTAGITGASDIAQGGQLSLGVTVVDETGNAPVGTLQYAWSATRGRFIGATNEATATYHADFTDASDVDVEITCDVTRPEDTAPTVAEASLDALRLLGIENPILNMFISMTEDTLESTNSRIWDLNQNLGTLDPNSDRTLDGALQIITVRWNDAVNRFILNSTGGNLGDFWNSNTAQSVFVVFQDGTTLEIPNSQIGLFGGGFVAWNVTDTAIQDKFLAISENDMILVGAGDTGSIGLDEDTGSDTETVTAFSLLPSPPTFTAPSGRYSVDERADRDIDSTAFFSGHTSLRFQNDYTPPSWITISDLDVVITDAPAVLRNTDFTIELVGVNDDGSVPGEIQLRVLQIDPDPVFTPPSRFDITEGDTTVLDLESALQNTESLEIVSGPSWVSVSDLTLVVTDAPEVETDTDFTVRLRARHSGTEATDTGDVQIRVHNMLHLPATVMEVSVTFPTATTALIAWAAVAGDIEGYEVNVSEGAVLSGGTWIPTGSSRKTTYEVQRLTRGTQYSFGVRARNDDGAGPASDPVTAYTPIASLHNALFFKECVNYFDDGARVSAHGNPSNIVRAVADNNYKTFSRVTDYVINIAVNGNPTRVDAFAVKCKGVERHSGSPTGGSGSGWTDVDVPATVQNWEGSDVSTTVAGFQHHLLLLSPHFTATSVRVQFQGTNVEIYEIALLEFGLEIDANGDFVNINPNFVDREGDVHPDPGGGIIYDAPIGADDRDKWEIEYVVRVVPGKTLLETPEDFLYWRSENRNHFFFMEPSRFPWRGFPAVFMRQSVPVRYRTDDKLAGEVLNFRVGEQ